MASPLSTIGVGPWYRALTSPVEVLNSDWLPAAMLHSSSCWSVSMSASSSPRRRPSSTELSRWFRRACRHEEGALQQLLALYRPLLMKLAQQRVKGALRAKIGPSDLVQTTVWKATKHFAAQSFHKRQNFLAWLIAILKNEAADVRRRFREAEKRKLSRERSLFSPETQHWLNRLSARLSDAAITGRGDAVEKLLAALERLPPHYQLVLRLRYYEKLTYEGIGTRLERSADAARVLHNRALKKLRSELDHIGNGEDDPKNPDARKGSS
jgi:RNA polymerase sigma-70 factor, ECF subfamily